METTSSKSLRIADAHRRFFASKADYISYRAAWSALTASGALLSASHYAAHALLTGRDLYRAFGRNRRGHGQAPYGAMAHALMSIGGGSGTAWTLAGLQAPASTIDALEALRVFLLGETAFAALNNPGAGSLAIGEALANPKGRSIALGEFAFSSAVEVTHA
jgi:hypothetical protein